MQSSSFKTPVPVTVTTALTKIMELNLGGLFSSLAFEVSPAGAALDAFEVRVRLHPNGSFIQFMAGTEFDSATIAMMQWSTPLGPHEVADGAVAAAIINVSCVDAVEFWAKVPAGTADVTIMGTQGQEG